MVGSPWAREMVDFLGLSGSRDAEASEDASAILRMGFTVRRLRSEASTFHEDGRLGATVLLGCEGGRTAEPSKDSGFWRSSVVRHVETGEHPDAGSEDGEMCPETEPDPELETAAGDGDGGESWPEPDSGVESGLSSLLKEKETSRQDTSDATREYLEQGSTR